MDNDKNTPLTKRSINNDSSFPEDTFDLDAFLSQQQFKRPRAPVAAPIKAPAPLSEEASHPIPIKTKKPEEEIPAIDQRAKESIQKKTDTFEKTVDLTQSINHLQEIEKRKKEQQLANLRAEQQKQEALLREQLEKIQREASISAPDFSKTQKIETIGSTNRTLKTPRSEATATPTLSASEILARSKVKKAPVKAPEQIPGANNAAIEKPMANKENTPMTTREQRARAAREPLDTSKTPAASSRRSPDSSLPKKVAIGGNSALGTKKIRISDLEKTKRYDFQRDVRRNKNIISDALNTPKDLGGKTPGRTGIHAPKRDETPAENRDELVRLQREKERALQEIRVQKGDHRDRKTEDELVSTLNLKKALSQLDQSLEDTQVISPQDIALETFRIEEGERQEEAKRKREQARQRQSSINRRQQVEADPQERKDLLKEEQRQSYELLAREKELFKVQEKEEQRLFLQNADVAPETEGAPVPDKKPALFARNRKNKPSINEETEAGATKKNLKKTKSKKNKATDHAEGEALETKKGGIPVVIWYVLGIILIVVILVQVYLIIKTTLPFAKKEAAFNIEGALLPGATADTLADELPRREINPNITDLRNTFDNADIVGYLSIPDTEIAYPVTKRSSSYYMMHSIQKTVNKAGSISLDFRNYGDELDQNTLIYGHHVENGTMFHDLINFADETYFRTHGEIAYINLYEEEIYEVFSFYETDINETALYQQVSFGADDLYTFDAFSKGILENSFYDTDIKLQANDRIITLYTTLEPLPGDFMADDEITGKAYVLHGLKKS